MTFDDNESFKEAVGSLRFNNPPSDPNTLQQMGSSGNMLPQDSERNEDICFNNPPNDPNTLWRVGSNGMLPQETSGVICFNNPASNPNTLALRRMGSSGSIWRHRRVVRILKNIDFLATYRLQ